MEKAVNKKMLFALGTGMAVLIPTVVLLPKILQKMNFHPKYEQIEYDFTGKKALLITTSHDVIDETGKATGVFSSEMTVPYYEFLDAKMEVDLSSIKGGVIPIEPHSNKWPLATHSDKRAYSDPEFLNKVNHSLKISEVDIFEYDLVFMAGGWGAAYDLGQSPELGHLISQAYANDTILGSVCHGALGFLQAVDENGDPLVKGKKITAVTNKQIKELRIDGTPLHPETELRKLGANFLSYSAFQDVLANYVAIDGLIVTGQNQNSGGETAQAMLMLLHVKNESI